MTLGIVLGIWLLLMIGCISCLRLGMTKRQWRRSLWGIALCSSLICLLTGCSNLGLDSRSQESDLSPEVTTANPSTTRPITHAMGTAQVPQKPERVVTIDTAALDAALAVGVKPVGSIVYGDFPKYLENQTDGVQSVGDGNQPNLETIARLDPDLILGTKIGTEATYRQVVDIAPTVLSEGSGRSGDWQDNFRLYADALGQRDAAEEALQRYQDQVAQLRQQLVNAADIQVSVLATGQGEIGFYTANSFSGSVLRDVGFSRPPIQERSDMWAERVSREDLTSLDGDVIFLIYSPTFQDSLALQDFTSDPVWSQLEAVQQNRVYEVSDEVWISGRNILAARQMLNDIAEVLLEPRTE